MTIKKGALAAVVSIAMQIPFAVSKNGKHAGVVGEKLIKITPVELDTDYNGYDQHWWWDNVSHYLAGYAIGKFFSVFTDDERKILGGFVITATGWEIFEYLSGERPWHTDENGETAWSFDHAAEDTILDTIVGVVGAYIATRK